MDSMVSTRNRLLKNVLVAATTACLIATTVTALVTENPDKGVENIYLTCGVEPPENALKKNGIKPSVGYTRTVESMFSRPPMKDTS